MTGIKIKNTNNNLISISKEDEVNENRDCTRNNYRDFYNLYSSRVQHGYRRNQPKCALTSTCTTRSKLYVSYLLTRMTLKRQFFSPIWLSPSISEVHRAVERSWAPELLSMVTEFHPRKEKKEEKIYCLIFPHPCGIKRKGET